MLDAMDAFQKVSAAARLPVILLFTKIDIFEELLRKERFTYYFPEYLGPTTSSSICVYLASRFQTLHLGCDGRLFIHVVNAADPKAFRKVFEEIESKILKRWPIPTANALSDDFSPAKPPRPLIIDDDHAEDGSLDAYSDYDDDPPLDFDCGLNFGDKDERNAYLSFNRELPLRG